MESEKKIGKCLPRVGLELTTLRFVARAYILIELAGLDGISPFKVTLIHTYTSNVNINIKSRHDEIERVWCC